VRQGLNKDLGFTDADRVENIRRIADVVLDCSETTLGDGVRQLIDAIKF